MPATRLFAGIEVFAWCRSWRRRRVGARPIRPAPTPRITLRARLEGRRRIRDLRLRSGNEGRQAIDADIGDHRLRLRLGRLILRTRLARFTVLAGLTMLARFPGLTMLSRRLVLAGLTGFAMLTRRLLFALIGHVVT